MNKIQLMECLSKLAMESGLSLDEFIKYSESKNQTKVSVFPENQEVLTKDDKTYISNLKVMLAQNLYKESKVIKLTDKLSKELKISDPPIGWWLSEKWDGIRAIWDGEKFISRGSNVGNPKVYTYVPEWFTLLMPPGIALDGEMWISRGEFSKVSALSNLKPGSKLTEKEINKKWKSVKYKVFDLPGNIKPFEERMKFLDQIIKDRCEIWKNEHKSECPLQITEQVKIESMEQLINTYKSITKEGAEGVMLRAPGSPYELKRSKYLLKYKIKEDSECIVKDYIPGDGRLKGLLGSLRCELLLDSKPSGIMFNIGTGFSDEQREKYSDEKSEYSIPLGSLVSFSYMELSKDSIPRHPVFRGIRYDIKNSIQLNEEKNFKDLIINNFELLIKGAETSKEANWQFKRKAYKDVITTLKNTTEIIDSSMKALDILNNAGLLKTEKEYYRKNNEWKSETMKKIDTIIKTGHLMQVDKLSEDPKVKAISELTKIPEIGPAAADKLYSKGIDSIPKLIEEYTKDLKLLNVKQAIGLKYYSDLEKRIPREEMNEWNEFFQELMKKTINQMGKKPKKWSIEIVGSYRREKESSGDIDVLVSSDKYKNELIGSLINNLYLSGITNKESTFSAGTTKYMGVGKLKETYRHIDIFYYSQKEYPFALLFSTGSGNFNVEMRQHAIKNGYSLSEKQLKYLSGESVTKEEYLSDINKEYPETEQDIFKFLQFEYKNPRDRK